MCDRAGAGGSESILAHEAASAGPKLGQAGFQVFLGIVVDFEALADVARQGEGEASAEVLPEFFEALDQPEPAAGVALVEFRGVEFEPEPLEELEDAIGGGGGKKPGAAGVEGIEGDAQGDGFPVAPAEVRQLFEFVGAPMAEVEWPG